MKILRENRPLAEGESVRGVEDLGEKKGCFKNWRSQEGERRTRVASREGSREDAGPGDGRRRYR